MRFLELCIPPPIVGLVVATGMWVLAHGFPETQLPALVRIPLVATLVILGVAVASGGVLSFRRARTTVNPLRPEKSAVLVSGGVYSFTRNPMYLGMLLVLCAWSVYLASIWTLAGPLLFALFITRFQIVPEERALEKLFGESFSAYRQRVRRWL